MSSSKQNIIYAGAFERLGVGGVSMASGNVALGIRFIYPQINIGLFDGREIILSLDKTFSAAPDQSYVRYAWHMPLTFSGVRRFGARPRHATNSPIVYDYAPGESVRIALEWSFDGRVVTGRYASDGPVQVGLLTNGCFARGLIEQATAEECRISQDDMIMTVQLRGKFRSPYLLDSYQDVESVWFGLKTSGGNSITLHPVDLAPGTPLHFSLHLVQKRNAKNQTMPACEPASIDRAIKQSAQAYESDRMHSGGIWAGAAEAVASLAGYSRTYDPKQGRIQTTVNRTWGGLNSPGGVFGWDNFFTSYLASWEDHSLAADSLEHICTIYSKGWHRPDVPAQRNLIIPILYCRTLAIIADEALARRTWPVMMAMMRFWFSDRGDGRPWRDGNNDGLIESGSAMNAGRAPPGFIIQNAMDETGYDDLPSYSAGFMDGRRALLANGVEFDWTSRTLTLTPVCQNSLYCASCRIMARLAKQLGFTADALWLENEAVRIADRMHALLYCVKDGFFRDRLWNGTFSPVKTMTLFYPLLAGIADRHVKDNLRRMLLDPEQFFGDNLIPTVSRDDPAYCDGLDHSGNYWRGNIWPPTTYIVYLAIKEAGWDEIAAEYARRVLAQFMEYWNRYGHAYENYPAEGKVDHTFFYPGNWGGREIRYVWAAMMALCGLEEVFGLEVLRPGFRFGNTHLPSDASWTGFWIGRERVKAEAGPGHTSVHFGDRWSLDIEPGTAVREFIETESGFSFCTTADKPLRAVLNAKWLPANAQVTANELPLAGQRQNNCLVFNIPAASQRIQIK